MRLPAISPTGLSSDAAHRVTPGGDIARGAERSAQRRSLFPYVQREHLLLAAVVCISWGALIDFGYISFASLLGILVGLMLVGAALVVPSRTRPADRVWWGIAAVCLAIATFRYVGYLAPADATGFSAVLAASVAAASVLRRTTARVLASLTAVAGMVGLTALGWRWGHAGIDVFSGLRTAADSLLAGHNPYTPTFPALFQTMPNTLVHQAIHFDYLPGAVLFAVPGELLGDVRLLSIVAAVALAAFAVRLAITSYASQERVFRVLVLCVAMPLTVAMLRNAWLDIYSVAGFAGWLALRRHHRRWAVVCLTVSLVVKPTLLLALIPVWLWSRPARRETAIAIGLTAAVILPFAVMTGFQPFFHDVVGVYGSLGFRYDGLTLSAWSYEITGSLIPVAATAVAAAFVAYFALHWRPADISQALTAGAFLTTAAFLLGKQAFLNYYFIPAWLLILALAAERAPVDMESEMRLPALLSIRVRRWQRAQEASS